MENQITVEIITYIIKKCISNDISNNVVDITAFKEIR